MINAHMALALILGAFVLGYLLAEWYFDGILRKTDVKLEECASTIEQLVAENDGYSSLVDMLRSNERLMSDQNGMLLAKLNRLEVKTGHPRTW